MKRITKDLKGILLDGGKYFRVYDKSHPEGFIDYDIRHNDLDVTIHADFDTCIYGELSDSPYIDHSPEVLGLKLESIGETE